MVRRVTVRGVIVKNGKIFAQKLKARDGGEKDFWCTPGGGLEANESIHDGLTRELIEETGVEPVIGQLLYVQQYQEPGREFLEFFFLITNAEDYEQIDLAATTHGHIEVAQYGFVDPKTEHILPEFFKNIDFTGNIESQQKVEFFNYLTEESK